MGGVDGEKGTCERKRKHAGVDEDYGAGPEYWNNRYKADPDPFDWLLKTYKELTDLIGEVTRSDLKKKILHVGCGNSLLTEEMYDAGYHSIVNIDTSPVVVEQMATRNAKRREMKWLEMDCTCLNFEDSSFDAVIDKSVMDTLACGDNGAVVMARYMKEVQRVLRPGGTFLCITFGNPKSRLEYFQTRHLEFSVRQQEIPSSEDSKKHWAYILRRPSVVGTAPSLWPEVEKELTITI